MKEAFKVHLSDKKVGRKVLTVPGEMTCKCEEEASFVKNRRLLTPRRVERGQSCRSR